MDDTMRRSINRFVDLSMPLSGELVRQQWGVGKVICRWRVAGEGEWGGAMIEITGMRVRQNLSLRGVEGQREKRSWKPLYVLSSF